MRRTEHVSALRLATMKYLTEHPVEKLCPSVSPETSTQRATRHRRERDKLKTMWEAPRTRAMMQGDRRRDYEMRATRETSIAVRCIYLGGDNQGTHAKISVVFEGVNNFDGRFVTPFKELDTKPKNRRDDTHALNRCAQSPRARSNSLITDAY